MWWKKVRSAIKIITKARPAAKMRNCLLLASFLAALAFGILTTSAHTADHHPTDPHQQQERPGGGPPDNKGEWKNSSGFKFSDASRPSNVAGSWLTTRMAQSNTQTQYLWYCAELQVRWMVIHYWVIYPNNCNYSVAEMQTIRTIIVYVVFAGDQVVPCGEPKAVFPFHLFLVSSTEPTVVNGRIKW